MPRTKYKMSPKRLAEDIRRTDFNKRIKILTLRRGGMTFKAIGDKFGMSRQGATYLYNKVKDMTIEELENQRRLSLANRLEA